MIRIAAAIGALLMSTAAFAQSEPVGQTVEVLVGSTEGRKASETHRLSGRAEDSRLVHFAVPDGSAVPRPGDVVTVVLTEASTFHLVADGGPVALRRTRAGDAWDAADAASCGVPTAPAEKGRTTLGMPTLRVATIPIYDVSDNQRTRL